MRDNQIMQILIPLLSNQLSAYVVDNDFNMSAPLVKQSFQPTQQGTTTEPCVYVHKIADKRYGHPEKSNIWDVDNEVMIHTETEIIETTFQCSATVIQDPSNIDQVTATDLVNAAATILQSDSVIQLLRNQGLNMYRITDIRVFYFQDDRDRQEVLPSFDFILQHKTVTINTTPAIETIDAAQYSI